jgi:competence protein ComEC
VPPNAELQALRSEAHEHRIVWRKLQFGHTIEVDGALVEVVNPPLPDWERRRVRNDDSLVLRLRFGEVEFLFTGDAGEEFERRLEPGETAWPVRILKVGHHGSLTASSAAFVEGFAPAVALVSVGRHNTFGHPAPQVLARFNRIGAQVFRTDLDGAIVVETDGRAVAVRTMAGRAWRTPGR